MENIFLVEHKFLSKEQYDIKCKIRLGKIVSWIKEYLKCYDFENNTKRYDLFIELYISQNKKKLSDICVLFSMSESKLYLERNKFRALFKKCIIPQN
ncbi:hypothetical protein [Haploplasma modicum]|uniref:hypothetical protein n=1 Tax=Haploplasma modicum TaxID=2150 RepID=UPI0004788150|nr:hypothetical protein [Haploplasma modicum]